jgi:hypothetical protein
MGQWILTIHPGFLYFSFGWIMQVLMRCSIGCYDNPTEDPLLKKEGIEDNWPQRLF